MKNRVFFISILLFSLLACCKDEPIAPIPITPPEPLKFKEGVHVSVNELKLLIPDAYKKGKIAVYKTLGGKEDKYKIKFTDSLILDRELNGIKYTAAEFRVDMSPLAPQKFSLGIKSIATFGDEKTLIKGIKYGQYFGFENIAYNNSNNITTIDGKFDKTDPFNRYINSYEFNGKIFKDVFRIKNSSSTKYSELAYNIEFGIIAYRDENNDLFVFDRFE